MPFLHLEKGCRCYIITSLQGITGSGVRVQNQLSALKIHRIQGNDDKYEKQGSGGNTRGNTESCNCTARRLFLLLSQPPWCITDKVLIHAFNLKVLGFWFLKGVVNMDNTTLPEPNRYTHTPSSSKHKTFTQQKLPRAKIHLFIPNIPNSLVCIISSLPRVLAGLNRDYSEQL